MNDNKSIQLPNLEHGEEIVISKRKKQSKPRFTMTGNKMKSIEIIADLTKPEAFTFKHIQRTRGYEDNIAYYSTKDLTPTEKNVFSKGYKMLLNKGLIFRIQKGSESIYMFNPDFIIPNEYEPALRKWNKLTSAV